MSIHEDFVIVDSHSDHSVHRFEHEIGSVVSIAVAMNNCRTSSGQSAIRPYPITMYFWEVGAQGADLLIPSRKRKTSHERGSLPYRKPTSFFSSSYRYWRIASVFVVGPYEQTGCRFLSASSVGHRKHVVSCTTQLQKTRSPSDSPLISKTGVELEQ